MIKLVSIEVQVGKKVGKKVDLDDMKKKKKEPFAPFRREVFTGTPKQTANYADGDIVAPSPGHVEFPINDGFDNAEKDILSVTAQIRTAALVSPDKEAVLKLLRKVLREVSAKTTKH